MQTLHFCLLLIQPSQSYYLNSELRTLNTFQPSHFILNASHFFTVAVEDLIEHNAGSDSKVQ